MKPGIYEIGEVGSNHLLWIDSEQNVVNGGYPVFVSQSGENAWLGVDGPIAKRICDVPSSDECPRRDYNSVLQYVEAHR